MTPDRARELGVDYRRGVVVVELARQGATEFAKAFPPGTVIYEFSGRRVNSLDEFLARMDRQPRRRQNDDSGVVAGVRPDGKTVKLPLYRQ